MSYAPGFELRIFTDNVQLFNFRCSFSLLIAWWMLIAICGALTVALQSLSMSFVKQFI